MPVLNIRQTLGPAEYPALVQIWRSAVDATHDFLADDDRAAIEARLASDYFPAVALWVAERADRPIAFAGVADDKLEMLFVAADDRGSGAGTALLAHAVRELGAWKVDVNEQNTQAVDFYARRGFDIVGRSDADDEGRPYPLLHLKLS